MKRSYPPDFARAQSRNWTRGRTDPSTMAVTCLEPRTMSTLVLYHKRYLFKGTDNFEPYKSHIIVSWAPGSNGDDPEGALLSPPQSIPSHPLRLRHVGTHACPRHPQLFGSAHHPHKKLGEGPTQPAPPSRCRDY